MNCCKPLLVKYFRQRRKRCVEKVKPSEGLRGTGALDNYDDHLLYPHVSVHPITLINIISHIGALKRDLKQTFHPSKTFYTHVFDHHISIVPEYRYVDKETSQIHQVLTVDHRIRFCHHQERVHANHHRTGQVRAKQNYGKGIARLLCQSHYSIMELHGQN